DKTLLGTSLGALRSSEVFRAMARVCPMFGFRRASLSAKIDEFGTKIRRRLLFDLKCCMFRVCMLKLPTSFVLLSLAFAGLTQPKVTLASRHHPSRDRVLFNRIESDVAGTNISVTPKESRRIERFLAAIFPLRTMRHLEHTSEQPIIERASYSV